MNRKISNLSRRYQKALKDHLKVGHAGRLDSARGLGGQALEAGLQTLDLAKLHEQTLVGDVLPRCPLGKRAEIIKRAGAFFAVAITPIEAMHPSAREATAYLKRFIEALSQRTVELAASNLELSLEIRQRKAAEAALKKSEHHYSELLEKSERLQEQLRRLSRQILSAQEDERKEISRELHDVIAQTLTGINVRLATLKREAAVNTKGIDRNIAKTQRLVEKSVNIVHNFARQLRPAVLDDLGLIPALHSYMKNFTARSGVRTHLTASADVERVDTSKRTVLFRVAQEALTNVARHARATRVDVSIHRTPECVCMKIRDDGKSFRVDSALESRDGKRLGLLGMRERLEMVGGHFEVQSAPGEGTTVTAKIPSGRDGAACELLETASRNTGEPFMKRTTVLLAEDHMIVREGLRKMLELEPDLEVIGEAQDGRQAVALAKKQRPDVLLMDIAMPMLNGLEATRQVLKALPAIKVLILSAHSDDAYVRTATEAGASGFLLKQTSAQDVCRAIREVQKGNSFFSPSISRRMDRLAPKSPLRAGGFSKKAVVLTSREMEVLQLIAEGKANKETALELGIGMKTVEKHREHLMMKLDIHDTAGLTRYAIAAGIIESSVQVTIV